MQNEDDDEMHQQVPFSQFNTAGLFPSYIHGDDMGSPEHPGSELLSPVGRSEVSMPEWERDSDEWERQLQRELLLIQRQQQIQKQLLIAEFQKQHQALLRQHQAQLQEHIKLQQALLTLRQQQEALAEERTPEIEIDEEVEEVQGEELERHRREQQQHPHLNHRKKERSKESPDLFPSGAMASTEVRQKLHDFLLNKSSKDTPASGHPLNQRAKLWYITSQHMSMEQKSPPLGEMPPTFRSPLPSGLDTREEDFPLRKTASEPNLKVRSRLKQKVSERRSGPIQRRRDGSVLVTPPKKRPLELSDSSANDSSPSSGPSSPIGLCSNENGTTFQASSAQMEKYLPQGGFLKADGSLTLLNLYTSPSLPNLTLSLHSGPSPISPASSIKERAGEASSVSAASREPKVNTSHQALLQHLLLKEQTRQQKILSSGSVSVLPQSPLVMKERSGGGSRPRLPRHRPLNRTQSAPLPQSTLAQLVLQQQHHNFVEKQKQYHQQVHMNQVLSQSIEQLRNPTAHLEEDEEARALELTLPPAGVIRSHSSSSSSSSIHLESGVQNETSSTPASVIRVKEEPLDPESRMEEGGRSGGVAGRRDERNERGEEPMKEVKSEQNVENMTETDV
ncbi:histone deacetylase 9-B isoform X4 [Tachysurus fulvidraco]|uniref:histone deacetylase 9-B isoform X4 n=2 Tax=Tachysurus fulvidraco TaxID=1234273 RepID=UPI001FEF3CA3|nr:histone deacetylase 9-B isoform X4 [Tachysurus fulvidraco]